MAVLARDAWRRLEADAGAELLVTTGGLDAGLGAGACASALEACGVDHGWLGEREIQARFGGIAARPGGRMLFQPDSGGCLAGRPGAPSSRVGPPAPPPRGGGAARPWLPPHRPRPRRPPPP